MSIKIGPRTLDEVRLMPSGSLVESIYESTSVHFTYVMTLLAEKQLLLILLITNFLNVTMKYACLWAQAALLNIACTYFPDII